VSGPATIDLVALWNDSLAEILGHLSSPAQRQWLAATHPVGFSDDTIILAAPHAFAREWLQRNCADAISTAIGRAAGRELVVVLTVQANPTPVDANAVHAATDGLATADDRWSTGADGDTEIEHERVDRDHARADRPAPGDVVRDGTASSAAFDDRGGAHDGYDDRVPLHAPGRPAGPTVSLPDARPSSNGAGSNATAEPDTQLNPKYSFDDFVIGSSNRFAHAAATAVAEAPAKSYNPLFIYGGAGLGKTHLLHAIGHYVRNLYPRLKVRYVTSEQFTNEFINAIRDDRITSFQRLYRQADVLLIDDIQFLQSKERTQEEFFHTFNALHNAEKQIVISSDRPPKQIAQLEDRLRSRFEWGLMTDVQPPDLETRIAILRKKAESDRLGVAPDVLELIASKVQSNIRELEGALIRVSAYASLQRAPADQDMAEAVLKDLFPDGRDQEVSVQLIMDEVAAYFSLTVEELCSPSRSRQLVTARQIAMYLTRELTEMSLPRIGKAFGGRDHTTVMHAKSKIAGLMQERRPIYDQVQELTNRVKTRARNA
jgi:chromosomal replication initiator protein